MKIQVKVKPILDERGISMREFARNIDYNRDQVRKFCTNQLVHIPIVLIERTCAELDVSLHDIIELK